MGREHNEPERVISIAGPKIVPTVRVEMIDAGNEVTINREDYDPKLHRVAEDIAISELGSRKPMAAEQLLVQTLDRLAAAINPGGNVAAPAQASAPVDNSELKAALAEVAELKAILISSAPDPADKPAKPEKAPAARKPRKVTKRKVTKKMPRMVEAKA